MHGWMIGYVHIMRATHSLSRLLMEPTLLKCSVCMQRVHSRIAFWRNAALLHHM